MTPEDQENSIPTGDEGSPDMPVGEETSAPMPMSEDFQPVEGDKAPDAGIPEGEDEGGETSEIDTPEGEDESLVPPPPPGEDEPVEDEEKTNWMPWIVVALIVVAVIIVIALFGGGSFGGGAASTPTPAAPEAVESYIQISQPVSGAVLDISNPVLVSGTGGGLFEGNVVVQARDTAGNVLAEQPTTIQSPDAGTGGEGPWSVQLSVQTQPGTPGEIVAFSTSPADGSITASAQVAVTYGQAVQPYIQIDQPVDGEVLDISSPVPVSGIGRGLPEGNVIVQARDSAGNVLAEQPTTIQSPDAGTGGEGPWSVQLSVQTLPGTPGEIVAFSTSPADGSITASAKVLVTFGQAVQSYIQIGQPASGAVLDIANPVLVSGTGGGLFEGNVVVQAQDSSGTVLAEQPTIIQSPDAGTGGEGPWSVQLTIPAAPGTTGQIVAFSPSPVDSTIMASDQVDVTYGQVVSYIQINQPASGAALDIASPVQVSGTGGALFEGNVVVQALDDSGTVLEEQPTIIQSPDAGTGGEGPWSVELTIPAELGTTGEIVAFSPSPADGSIMASDQVNVTYGQVEEPGARVNLEDPLWLLASLSGKELIPGTQITADFNAGEVAGSAGCNEYFASYESSGTDLTIGQAGTTRKACPEPEGVMEQENQYLALLGSAASYKIEAGQLVISDAGGQAVLVYNAAVIGQVNTAQPTEIPAGSTATIQVQDVSLADAPATVIGEQVISNPPAFPFPFEVTYDPEIIDPRFTYAVSVRITDEAGNLMFINTSAYNVITHDNPSVVEVLVESVQ